MARIWSTIAISSRLLEGGARWARTCDGAHMCHLRTAYVDDVTSRHAQRARFQPVQLVDCLMLCPVSARPLEAR